MVDRLEREANFGTGATDEARITAAHLDGDADRSWKGNSQLVIEDADDLEYAHGNARNAPFNTLASRADTRNQVMREDVVDPLGRYTECKCNSTNAIGY